MKKTLTILTMAVIFGCFTGAGSHQPLAQLKGDRGTPCQSDKDCNPPWVCTEWPNHTFTCDLPTFHPYDRPAIGVSPRCYTDSDCPKGYRCAGVGSVEGDPMGTCNPPQAPGIHLPP